MRDADARSTEPGDLGLVRIDAVRDPAAIGHPPDRLEVVDRAAAELLRREGVLVGILGEVRVQPHVEPLGELGRPPHQLGRHAERRARRERDAHHRARRSVVVHRDQPLGVGEDLVVVLHDRVGREPTVLLRQAHRPARRMEPHAELGRGSDLGADQVAAAAGMHVEVIGGRRAPAERELGEPDPGRDVRGLLVEAAPERIQRGQPVEERGDRRGPIGAGEVLVDVVMGVDEARA